MKKLIYGVLFLASVGITVVSCKKTEPKPNSVESLRAENPKVENADVYDTPKSGFDGEFQLGNEGRFLVFNNENGYSHAVDNPSEDIQQNLHSRINALSHYSWKKYVEDHPNQGLETQIEDEYFASILSADKTVQIGQHIFKVNPENEKVYALHVKDKNEYNELISNNENSSVIRVFSFNDEVLEAIKDHGGDPTPKGLFCKDRHAVEKSSEFSSLVTVMTNPEVKMKSRVKYNKAGIYFSLFIEAVHTNASSEFKFYFQLDNCSYAQRCGSSVSNYSHPWLTKTSGSGVSSPEQTEKYKFYGGMKQLKNYNFTARFRCENWLNPVYPNPYSVHFTEYRHIEDY